MSEYDLCVKGGERLKSLGRTCILNGSIALSPHSSLITATSAGRVCPFVRDRV